MSAPLRIGVLGCASIADRRMLPALVASPDIAVTAIASRSLDRARSFTTRFGGDPVGSYDALLEREDLDAIYLPLPTGLHHEWVSRSLHAGLHVLAEKPLATTAKHAAELVDLAAERSLVLWENFMFLHHGQHRRVRELIAAGAIGSLRSFSAAFGIPPRPADDVRYRPELGGGALLDVGVYPIRAAGYFLAPDLGVIGSILDYVDGVDLGGAALLGDGHSVTASLTFGFQHHYRGAYEFWGSEGRILLDRVFTPPTDRAPVIRIERANGIEELTLPAEDQFATVVAGFVAAIRDGVPDPANGPAAIVRQATLVDAIRDAAGSRP